MKSNIAESIGQNVTQQSTHNLDLNAEHSRVVVVLQNEYPECKTKSLTLSFSEKMGNVFYVFMYVCVCILFSVFVVKFPNCISTFFSCLRTFHSASVVQ
jgi:hypothetical protein